MERMTEQEMLERCRQMARAMSVVAANMREVLGGEMEDETRITGEDAQALTRLLKGYKRRGEALKRIAALKYENVPKTPLLLDVITLASEALSPHAEEEHHG